MKSIRLSRFTSRYIEDPRLTGFHASRYLPVFPLSRLLIFVAAATLLIPHAHAQLVEIPDPNLKRAVREALELPDEQPITQQEMRRLINLPAKNRGITDLTGLEYATNLKELGLTFNQVQDITSLAELVNLEVLILAGNPISNLSHLATLTQLQSLYLASVRITDLTPLSNLTQLKVLDLQHCREIQDITPLSNLTQLNRLEMSHNQITDISPLANLTLLEELRIDNNRVVDVSPLTNLTQLTHLTLANNAITDFRPLFGLNLQSVDVNIHKLQELASRNVNIPDSNLKRAIREAIGLPSETPFTQLVMSQLIKLDAGRNQIETLTGLEYATNLKSLALSFNQIRDITPLAGLINLELLALVENPIADLVSLSNLTQLEFLFLSGVRITDLTPLSNLTRLKELYLRNCWITDTTPLSKLTQLKRLDLSSNQIVDIRPLANLTLLEELRIDRNWISDFSSLQGLALTELRYDEACVLPDPPIRYRVESRNLPSILQGWDNGIQNLPALSHEDRISYHDLFWQHLPFGLHFRPTPQGWQTTGNIKRAIVEREELLAKNPNMLFLAEVRLKEAQPHNQYPEDWFGWVRDEDGNPVRGSPKQHSYLIDVRLPAVQDIIVQQAISVAKCGLYDGIMFDSWNIGGFFLVGFNEDGSIAYSEHVEESISLSIAQRIREVVPDDFLILVNSNWDKIPLAAPYVNGGFMETFRDYEGGYTDSRLAEIEDSLLWYEENLREPQINCLRGEGIATEPPDSPNNRRWMRFFTTMSLTLSDGYVIYTTGIYYQQHFWYDFWDANLGQPIGPKAQRYQNVPSLYIREFTNGWAAIIAVGKPKQSHCLPLLPPSQIGETMLRPSPTCSLTLTVKSILRVEALPISTVMEKSTSWICSKSPTASANLPRIPTAMGWSTASIWPLSPNSSASNRLRRLG